MTKYNFGYRIKNGTPMKWAFDSIAPNSSVLEIGPAIGTLTKNLSEKKDCKVDIVEIDLEAGGMAAQFANNAFIGEKYGDLEGDYWYKKISKNKYDYVVALDVIEHLKSTEMVLERLKSVLKEDGKLLLSVPNIAHNSVIINLLNNNFKYNTLGLLDSTHLKFFTYKTIEALFEKLNMDIISKSYIQKLVGDNEIDNSYNDIPIAVSDYLRNREYADVYQMLYILSDMKEGEINSFNTMPISLNYTLHMIEVYGDGVQICTIPVRTNEDINIKVPAKQVDGHKKIQINIFNTPCILSDLIVQDDSKMLHYYTNGCVINEDIVFNCDDPQIIIDMVGKGDINIHLRYSRLEKKVAQIITNLYFK